MKTTLLKTTRDKLGDYQGDVFLPVSEDLKLIDGEYSVDIKSNEQRTLTQNRAIHKYCAMVSQDLNDCGLDMKRVIKDEIDIPWTEASAKEYLWRPIQKALKLPDSTKDLNKKEVSQVYEVLSRHLSQKHNITTPFPSRHGD
jgi:hypothetical protein